MPTKQTTPKKEILLPAHLTTWFHYHGKTFIIYAGVPIVSFTQHHIVITLLRLFRNHSTKIRMNIASKIYHLGFRVMQTAGEWFVYYNDNFYKFDSHGIVELVRHDSFEAVD